MTVQSKKKTYAVKPVKLPVDSNRDELPDAAACDASLPWAQPADTAVYYDRSVAVARANLENKYGPDRDWPERAWQLYRPRERKSAAFRSLVPEYAIKFQDLKVVIARHDGRQVFVVERRSDGKHLRVVEPQE